MGKAFAVYLQPENLRRELAQFSIVHTSLFLVADITITCKNYVPSQILSLCKTSTDYFSRRRKLFERIPYGTVISSEGCKVISGSV